MTIPSILIAPVGSKPQLVTIALDLLQQQGEDVREAVVCGHCGEVLPLRVIVVSEGSRGGGFALVENADTRDERILIEQEEVNGK